MFGLILLYISLALFANLMVAMVSSICEWCRLQFTIRVVLLLPPRDSLSNLVSFESLNGTWAAFLDIALITLPRQDKLELIFLVSSKAAPYALLLDTLSEPARSTRLMSPREFLFLLKTSIVQIEWDLEDSLFCFVKFTCLFCSPNCNN